MMVQIERIHTDIKNINTCNATLANGITRLEDIGLGCELLLAKVVALAA